MNAQWLMDIRVNRHRLFVQQMSKQIAYAYLIGQLHNANIHKYRKHRVATQVAGMPQMKTFFTAFTSQVFLKNESLRRNKFPMPDLASHTMPGRIYEPHDVGP